MTVQLPEPRIHDASPPEGDFMLVGSDSVAVRFHKFQLQTYIPVWRSMFDASACESTSIDVDEVTSADLLILRAVMDTGEVAERIDFNNRLLRLCVKFDMPLLARIVLRGSKLGEEWRQSSGTATGGPPVPTSTRMEMLKWSSRLECPDVACSSFVDLSRESKSLSPWHITDRQLFNIETSRHFRPDWVFAFGEAKAAASKPGLAIKGYGPEYWKVFAVHFMVLLV